MHGKGRWFAGAIVLLLALVFVIAFLMAGRPAGGKNADKPGSARATLHFMFFGDRPALMDEVIAEFERRTADTLNVSLDFDFTPLADYGNKVKLKLSAGEPVDAVFDAPWLNLIDFVSQNNYARLDDYFHNDDYPGLKQAFLPSFLDSNRLDGGIYGIPFLRYYGDANVVYIRRDLREKYGLPEIQSIADLERFYDTVLRREDGVIPLIVDGNYGYSYLYSYEEGMRDIKGKEVWPLTVAPDLAALVSLSADRKRINGIALPGDPPETLSAFPAPFDTDDSAARYAFTRAWYEKGYVEPDIINRKDAAAMFKGGMAASFPWTRSQYFQLQQELQAAVPGAKLEVFVLKPMVREMQPESMGTDYRAWNFMAIPSASAHADLTMKFFDWLFAAQENHDLFEYGVEGVHWQAKGSDQYEVIPSANGQTYQFPGYEMTWNPSPRMQRFPADLDPSVLGYEPYLSREDTYFRSSLTGFSFTMDPVKKELATPGLPTAGMFLPYELGMVERPLEQYEALMDDIRRDPKIREAMEKIRDEIRRQLQAFLDRTY